VGLSILVGVVMGADRKGDFVGVLFSGVLHIYGAFCLYFKFHRSLFILCRDLVCNKILLIQKKG